MSPFVAVLVTLLPSYLLGALPWGLWVGRARGIDVRRHGSGNLGATNAYRLLGPRFGILVLVLDAAKGAAAVLWGRSNPTAAAFPGGPEWAAVAAGAMAVLGHMLTVFAGFRGGRGVATTIGAFLALSPLGMGLGLLAFVVAFAFSRRVSVGSLALALVLPFAVAWAASPENRARLMALAAVLSLLIIVRHLPNIRRLARGEEERLDLRRPTASPPSDPGSPR